MANEFSDELLSAFLDGELSPPEAAVVEAQLKSDAQALAVLEELKQLRVDLASLPTYTLPSGNSSTSFSKQVMARIQREEQTQVRTGVSKPAENGMSWKILLTLAAGVLLIGVMGVSSGWFSGKENPSQPIAEAPAKEPVVAPSEIASIDIEPETLVVSIRLSKEAIRGKALDQALAANGISIRSSASNNPLASELMARAKSRDLVESQASVETKAQIGEAILIEADASLVAKALQSLHGSPSEAATKIAMRSLPIGTSGLGGSTTAESESGGIVNGNNPTENAGPYAQHLNARLFQGNASSKIEAATAESSSKLLETLASKQAAATKTPARVLVLVEVLP